MRELFDRWDDDNFGPLSETNVEVRDALVAKFRGAPWYEELKDATGPFGYTLDETIEELSFTDDTYFLNQALDDIYDWGDEDHRLWVNTMAPLNVAER